MSLSYQWIYGTHTYELSDGAPFDVLKISNIDNPAVDAIVEQGPLQDGDTDTDMRLSYRVIQLMLQARNRVAPYDTESNRALLNRMFAPSRILGKLRLTFNNGRQYEIVCRPLGNMGADRSIEDDQLLKAVISLRCPDPLWYDPIQHSLSFAIAGGGGAFTVPTPVPTGLGTSALNQVLTLAYAGTYKDYPQFVIYGPITNPKIVNLATGKKIDFTGVTIGGGDYYTVDLRYGRKFVYKNGNQSDLRTGETTTDSQLATFALEANPIATDGINPIQVTGAGVNTATQIYMQYYDRFSGI